MKDKKPIGPKKIDNLNRTHEAGKKDGNKYHKKKEYHINRK